MRRAKEAGADSYLTKPFRPKELWAELERFYPARKIRVLSDLLRTIMFDNA